MTEDTLTAPLGTSTVAPSGPTIHLDGVTVRYGGFTAVRDLSLEIPGGSFTTVLGPSGSGKTTALMVIAGFLRSAAGRIVVGDRDVSRVAPHRRSFGVVFQSYALFPHRTVAENIGFPLRMRSISRGERRQRIARALELVNLPDVGHRYPSQLSGGQQQRVALARALVYDPGVLLLDEPLGALDKKMREHMQVELRALHQRIGTTIVHVTHDQDEALAMSDHIAVMKDGGLQQMATPEVLYNRPSNAFVADFIGESTMLRGTVEGAGHEAAIACASGVVIPVDPNDPLYETGAAATLMIRPECVEVADDATADGLPATVEDAVFEGDSIRYVVRLDAGDRVIGRMSSHSLDKRHLIPGHRVRVRWDRTAAALVRDA